MIHTTSLTMQIQPLCIRCIFTYCFFRRRLLFLNHTWVFSNAFWDWLDQNLMPFSASKDLIKGLTLPIFFWLGPFLPKCHQICQLFKQSTSETISSFEGLQMSFQKSQKDQFYFITFLKMDETALTERKEFHIFWMTSESAAFWLNYLRLVGCWC